MIHIKKAKDGDFETFKSILESLLRKEEYQYAEEVTPYILRYIEGLKKEVFEGKRLLYIATIENNVVGFFLTEEAFGGVAFGHWLGVGKAFRKQGVASRLLTMWEKDSQSKGIHAVFLWTTQNNIDFYKKRGFILMGTFPKSWFGHDHYLFYKTLGKPNRKIFT